MINPKILDIFETIPGETSEEIVERISGEIPEEISTEVSKGCHVGIAEISEIAMGGARKKLLEVL